MKYCFIIPDSDYFIAIYQEAQTDSRCQVLPFKEWESNRGPYWRFLFSYPTNRVLRIARKVTKSSSVLFSAFQKKQCLYIEKALASAYEFAHDTEICFIVIGKIYETYGRKLPSILRNKYPGCRIVAYFTDLYSNHRCDFKAFQEDFDLIASFDEMDVRNLGIHYLQRPYGIKKENIRDEKAMMESDVFFVGKAKDRLPAIMKVYHALRKQGLKCDFYIHGVDMHSATPQEGITYNHYLSYEENLQHVKHAKAIVEIVQGSAYSPTMRYDEALTFHKILISNCPKFKNPENRPNFVLYFDENDTELPDFSVNCDEMTYGSTDELSLDRFISALDSALGQ